MLKYYFFYYFYNKLNIINENNKKEICVLGQGWLAKGFLENINRSKYTITNITRNNFVNTPMLLSKLKNNEKNKDENIENQNNYLKKYIDNEINGNIEKIDLENSIVYTTNGNYNFHNKYLVVGLGSNTDTGIYWNTKINEINNLDKNKIKKICIVGSGPTGTELSFYLKDLGFDITIIDIEKINNLYNYLSTGGKEKILQRLNDKNIKLIDNSLFNETISKQFDYNIFAIDSISNNLTSNWKINSKLKVNNLHNVFAGGDCILQKYPKNAQVAYQQGKFIAQYLNGQLDIDQEFKYVDNGIALYIGDNKYYIELKNKVIKTKLEIPEFLVIIYYKLFK